MDCRDFFTITNLMDSYYDEEGSLGFRGPLQNLDVVVDYFSDHGLVSLARTSEWLCNTECQDPRDRIYGLLALVDWDSEGLSILPDYSKSTWNLARELVAGGHPWHCIGVLRMLKTDARAPEMRALVRDRLSPGVAATTSTKPRNFDFKDVVAATLSEDDNGRLICGLGYRYRSDDLQAWHTSELLASIRRMAPPEHRWYDISDRAPREVFQKSGGQIVALAHPEARPGDMLVFKTGWRGLFLKGFILRRANSLALDIVGNGIIIEDLAITTDAVPHMEADEVPQHDLFNARLVLSATPEDIMMFVLGVCEDFGLPQARERDPAAELEHLFVRPVSAPKAAAKLLPLALKTRHRRSR
jgi:hypothetical protein